MNYIRHLNAFFSFVRNDERLACSHVSLYLALFQYWNMNRFQNPFPVYRDNLMKQSKIGSKNTYHKCLRELHESKYIYYHPSASKFLPVKISVARLDIEEEPISRYRQLDLFSSGASSSPPKKDGSKIPSPFGEGARRADEIGEDLGGGPCPKIDTVTVPNMGHDSTDFDTGTVPKMGHIIKLNFKENKTVCKTPTQNFNKDEKIQKDKSSLRSVPKSVLNSTERSRSVVILSEVEGPTLSEVEEFFQQNNYPPAEANKFFLYNQGRGWMLTDKLPIKDWKAIAHKWMLNPKKQFDKRSPEVPAPENDLQTLFKDFLAGQKVFRLLQPEHFTLLNLQLSKQVMHDAWEERINQLSGSNQYSVNQLLQAYEKRDANNKLIQQDDPNLITLAKRIAVLRHFQQLQLANTTILETIIDNNKTHST